MDPLAPCSSINRALWRTVTELQEQNSALRFQVNQLERRSSQATLSRESVVGRESGKFLRMELEKERADSLALKQQLEEALAACAAKDKQLAQRQGVLAAKEEELSSCKGAMAAKEEQLAGCQVSLLEREGELADVHRDLRAAQGQLAAKEGELAAARAQVQGTRGLAQFTEAELQRCQQQLQVCEAKAQAQVEELAAARAGLEAAQRETARLEQAQQAHLASIAKLERQLSGLMHVGSAPVSPAASLGAQSDGCDSPAGAATGAASSPCLHLPVQGPSTTTVFNVMMDCPGRQDDGALQAEQKRLTFQVVSLQDKLEALQAAHEALLGDYTMVTDQLAARQAEAQMARLSPESAQLKQQVLGLQEQVSALQQELFSYHMQSPAEGGSSGGNPPGGSGPTDGPSLKRSFTRAASTLGHRILHPLRKQKSTVSQRMMDSRASSATESVTSVQSCSISVSMHGGQGGPHRSPGISPLAGSLGLLSPGDTGLSLRPVTASPVGSPTSEALLALRQQLSERGAEAERLQQQLGDEAERTRQLQEALLKQGAELAEVAGQLAQAREALAVNVARLEAVEAAAAEVRVGVAAEQWMPPAGAEHAKCIEAVDSLFRQVWKERMVRQKLEFQLEQERSRARLSEASELDEALLESLQAEAQAVDTMNAELQRARGHQLQLQQRVEALQLQLANQAALLESVSRGVGAGGCTGSPYRSPCSPSKADVERHNLLRAAELKVEEAALRMACCEREVARLQRRERALNQALSQAAEWRKGAEKQQEEAQAVWKRRWEKERTAATRLESRLRASLAAQQGLLSGLEVLQALLQAKAAPGGASPQGRRTTSGLAHTTASAASGMQQEALKHVSSLLRKCSGRLQQSSDLLSPERSAAQQSEGGPRSGGAKQTFSGGSPRVGHLSISAHLAQGLSERLSEPISPRVVGTSRQEFKQEPRASAKLRPPPQSKPLEEAHSLDEVLQAILQPGSEEWPGTASPTAAGPRAGAAMGEGAEQAGGGQGQAVAAPPSGTELDLPEGSRLGSQSSDAVSGSPEAGHPPLSSMAPSPSRLPPPSSMLALPPPQQDPADDDMQIPAHRPGTGQCGGGAALSPTSADSPQGQGKGAASGGSPRMKALVGALKRSIGCKETTTHSSGSTPGRPTGRSRRGSMQHPAAGAARR